MEENPHGGQTGSSSSNGSGSGGPPPFDYQQHYRRQNANYGQGGGPWRQAPPQGPGDNTVAFSILAYLPFLWLVGLLADRENPTVKFHVNQGIILTIFECVLSFALAIVKTFISLLFSLTVIFSGIATLLNGLLSFAGTAVILAYIIAGIINAAKGRRAPLPLIGNLFTVLR